MNMNDKIEKTVEWIRSYCASAGAKGALVGLSGGIDSSVVAHLLKMAFPETSLGVILPCKSSPSDKEHAESLAKSAGIRFVEVDITSDHESVLSKVEGMFGGDVIGADEQLYKRMSDANLRARLRMSTLYAFANNMNYLVAGTDNAAEILTGYFTKYGDGGVDFLPISNLTKREVYEWARYFGVPVEIIDKAPSAGLWDGQTDEDEMGVTYNAIDDYIEGKSISEKDIDIIERLKSRSAHKKKMPPGPPQF
jgi:NAD+ synthase